MKRFAVTIICFLGIPVLLLVLVFCVTDPYRTLHKFDPIDVCDGILREYESTELFLRNNQEQHYNAFVFASSKANAISTYLWKNLIGEDVRPFLFQAWSEDVEGIWQKVKFVDRMGNEMEYVLLLLDPTSFPPTIDRSSIVHLRHPLLSGQSRLEFELDVFKNFIQKPSEWVRSIREYCNREKRPLTCDTITNDVSSDYAEIWDSDLKQDSLNRCARLVRENFIENANHLDDRNIHVGDPRITEKYESYLRQIKSILDAHHTHYKILITPSYIYKNDLFNPKDLNLLNAIFGSNNVYNYLQKNEFTTDYNYYSDPDHPGLLAGTLILKDIYSINDSLRE